MSTKREPFKSEHFTITSNALPDGYGHDHEHEYGVFVKFGTSPGSGISTTEAREAGAALIKLADQIEEDQREAQRKTIPEEPKGIYVIVQFNGMVPTVYHHDGRWSYLSTPERKYTWPELIEKQRNSGHPDPLGFTVLYRL